MLGGFSALNESSYLEFASDSSDSESKGEESIEYRDEDYLTLYNRALASFGQGAYDRAEKEFRHLTNSPYFSHCGFYSGNKKRAITVQLQFNSHRYLGLCLSQREAYAESLNELEKSLEIDKTDPTLFFKFAVTAVRAGDLQAARNAIEMSFSVIKTAPGQRIRHWPSLDLIITITYKIEDYMACLRYIEWALQLDPDYSKGKRLRGQIYEEYPFLHPDPAFHSREPKPRPVVQRLLPPKPVIQPKILKISKASIKDIVDCVVNEYHDGGEGRMKDILLPCSVQVETGPKESVDKMAVVRNLLDSLVEEIVAKKDEELETLEREQMNESERLVRSILEEDVITKALNVSFVRKVIMKTADFAVGESYANSMSKRSRGGASTAFLNEVRTYFLQL